MRLRDTLLFLILSALASCPVSGQNAPLKIQMTGTHQREPMNVFPGQTRLEISGLAPGNTYQVIALGAYADETATFRLHMSAPEQETSAQALSNSARPQLRRFKASAATERLLVDAQSDATGVEIPMYLSLSCLDCPEAIEQREQFLQKFADAAPPPDNLGITQGNTANDLVTNVLVGGNCFDVSGISSKGQANSRGTFSNGTSSIKISNGLVLCTGPVSDLPGPNTLNNKNGGFNTDPGDDANLAKLTTGNQYDISVIEFDFKPTANMVQFDYVFGSEEYCEFVNSQYNDVFGFFISGPGINGVKNLALIPNTNTPISVNDVNHLKNSIYYRNNKKYQDCAGMPTVDSVNLQLDGFTTVMTATAVLQPCQTYHIKLAIADVGDADYTSAVFLRANSFDAGGEVKANAVYPSAAAQYSEEGCSNGFIRFYRGSGDINQPLPVTYTIAGSSTAVPGVDYDPLPGSITIPAGQNEVLVPVNVLKDQLAEGTDSIVLLLDNACSCQQQYVSFLIKDQVPVTLSMTDQLGCAGFVNLTPTLLSSGLPPLTYQWSNGAVTPEIKLTAPGSSLYTVTVTDACGLTATAAANAVVDQSPTAILSGDLQFCPGGSGQLPIALTGNGPWKVDISSNGVVQQQSFATSPGMITVSAAGTYTLTAVSSAAGCTGLAGGTSTVQVIDVQVNAAAQNPPCFGDNGSVQTAVNSNTSTTYTYKWSNGASGSSLNSVPQGNYTVTVTTAEGCTAQTSASLTAPAALSVAVGQVNHIDCYNPSGNASLTASGGTPDYQYAWSNGQLQSTANFTAGGIYQVTVTDAHQCTTLAAVTIAENTTPPQATATAPDEITCNTSTVALSSAGSSLGQHITYSWKTSDGHILSGSEESTPTVDAAGTYTLLVTNTINGCTATAEAKVIEDVNYPTALDLQVTPPGCHHTPGAIHVDAVQGGEGPYVFSIDGGKTFNAVSVFQSLAPGAYSILVQDANGCEYTQSTELIAPVEPDVTLAPEVKLNYGESATLSAVLNLPISELDSIYWTPQTWLIPTNRPDEVVVNPFKSTNYTVTVISKDGCSDQATLSVRVGDPHIYAPNVFKPGTAANDMFKLYSNDKTVSLIKHLQVFDRWGNAVFIRDNFTLNDDRNGGWDGHFRGKMAEPGVFTWWAEVQLASGEQVQLRGDVTLLE